MVVSGSDIAVEEYTFFSLCQFNVIFFYRVAKPLTCPFDMYSEAPPHNFYQFIIIYDVICERPRFYYMYLCVFCVVVGGGGGGCSVLR